MGTDIDVRRHQGGIDDRRRILPTSYMAAVLYYETCREVREPRELHDAIAKCAEAHWADGEQLQTCLASTAAYMAADRSRLAYQLVDEMSRLATRDEIKRELHVLVNSFPNAGKIDLQIYGRALALDVIDLEPTIEAVIVACMTLRRQSNFLPTISEALSWVQLIDSYVRQERATLSELPALLEEARKRTGAA